MMVKSYVIKVSSSMDQISYDLEHDDIIDNLVNIADLFHQMAHAKLTGTECIWQEI